MSWKPTEGMTRANVVMKTIRSECTSTDQDLTTPMMQARLYELVGLALDKALNDFSNSVRDALNWQDSLPRSNGHDDFGTLQSHLDSHPANYASPDLSHDQDGNLRPMPPKRTVLTENAQIDVATLPEPKKRRGRPAGSTNKPKKAKRAKVARGKRAKAEPVAAVADAPVELPTPAADPAQL